jgi:hypothetical protein
MAGVMEVGSAQVTPRENLVALAAYVEVRSLVYTRGSADLATVFRNVWSGPITIRVELGNNTDRSLVFGAGQRPWTDAVSLSMGRVRGIQVEDVTAKVSLRREALPAVTAHTVPIERSASSRIVVDLGGQDGLPEGSYQVLVNLQDWALDPFSRRLNNILSRRLTLELKDARTNDEFADAYLQLSYDARRAGRLPESREWSQKVLALNPVSIAAITDLADSWFAERNCGKAIPLFQQAVNLLTTGADPGLRIQSRDEWAATLRGPIALCMRK